MPKPYSSTATPSHKRLIILDFDHTVFNTTAFVAAQQQQLEKKFNIDKETFTSVRKSVKDCCTVIDIDTFVASLPHEDKSGLHAAIHETAKRAAEWIFSDVEAFLSAHASHFDILIQTHGDKELQTEKIMHANLPDDIRFLISTKPKEKVIADFVHQYEHIYIIEDKQTNIDAIKQTFPEVTAYFIARKEDHPYKDDCPVCKGEDHAIESLNFTIPQ